ncbi:hypothetical protein N8A98_00400 (plasmid) [Devosia neptuniae]|uniref:Glycosyltransferase RgtA/B/C/D-like domain-containing protein n=1 Tax=Devosia neptuniae TaxID=191302 RepID=A0ABY6C6Z2_9HYPH|nr:hypothetical protein [Devosia neptuniae]UXN68017.1 hypothetical protein N8A98_00400 [Devosia neptuniae]
MTVKRIAITTILGGLVLAFLAVLALAILREVPGTNSYAVLAEGWLNGRFDADHCFDTDCALFNGLTYIIFPPLPGVIALPFVALFGSEFRFFVVLSALTLAGSGWLWWQIFRREAAGPDQATLLVLLTLFATPLAFVVLRGDGVWFFAQSWGFLFSSAALYSALVRRNALLAGLFIGMAFLCRQMTILYLPLLYVLLLEANTAWYSIDRAAIKRALSLAAFPIIAILIYFAYNYARFGSPLETGYSYIFPVEWDVADSGGFFLRLRVRELGIFSPDYFLFNAIYMFVAGPHVDFAGRYMTEMAGFDANGASLFLVTPVILLAFLGKWDRAFWFGLGTCGLVMGLTLLYHSNGFSQYSAQRYALDWLPILLIFLGRALKAEWTPPFALLLAYSMGVTLAMLAIGGIIAG